MVTHRKWWIAALLVAIAGIFLRVHLWGGGFTGVTPDERDYASYVRFLGQHGILAYSELLVKYAEVQKATPVIVLPPTRVLYPFCGWLCQRALGGDEFYALRVVSSLSSILAMSIGGLFAARVGGRAMGLLTLLFLAVAPLQIYLSHRYMLDGFETVFVWTALWALWEGLQPGRSLGWLVALALALGCLILTKENFPFPVLGLIAVAASGRRLGIGRADGALWAAGGCGLIVGAAFLVLFCGGYHTTAMGFSGYLSHKPLARYSYAYGSGPYYTLLIEMMLVSPVVTVLAIAGMFRCETAADQTMLVFFLVTFSCLSLGYVAFLRLGNMWDLPIRWFAAAQLLPALRSSSRARQLLALGAVLLIAAMEFHQFKVLFVQGNVVDPAVQPLCAALHMLP